MVASVTAPLATSTVRTQTPLPVTWRLRASYGYSGLGANDAVAFAPDIEAEAAGRPTWAVLIGAAFVGLGTRGGGVDSSTNSGFTSGIGGGSGTGISSGGGVG